MIVYLKDVIRYATDLHTRKWAVETLAQMEKYIVERDRIEAENKERREAWEKRVAEAEKKRKSPAKKAKP
jgi:predicted  nucleic acid-binding Zn-ribbon protein